MWLSLETLSAGARSPPRLAIQIVFAAVPPVAAPYCWPGRRTGAAPAPGLLP